MADVSSIEWTDATWNPVRGCTKISPGCKHCYAETFAERWRGIPGHAYEQGFDLRLVPEALALPIRWKKPRQIFVNSMSDLFHEEVPEDYIRRVFDVMEQAKHHTFQVLTKRASRLVELAPRLPWPRNVWMGVSVEDNRYGVPRIAHLLKVPAAIRFLSVEPLLEDVDLKTTGALGCTCPDEEKCWGTCKYYSNGSVGRVGWVIVGGESGAGARPMAQEWAASIVRQCKAAGVPVFVKQLGAVWARENSAHDQKGGVPEHWPEHLRVREMPNANL